MGSGDLTASTPTECVGMAAVKTHVDTLNLTATTDKLVIVPVSDNAGRFVVFKVEREA